MAERPVVEHLLAVVRGDDQDRPIENPACPQVVDEVAKRVVRVGNGSVITGDQVPKVGLRHLAPALRLVPVRDVGPEFTAEAEDRVRLLEEASAILGWSAVGSVHVHQVQVQEDRCVSALVEPESGSGDQLADVGVVLHSPPAQELEGRKALVEPVDGREVRIGGKRRRLEAVVS